MDAPAMARLTTVASPFEARLLAARLGADGILWELRGNVDGIYPGLGVVEVLVSADQLTEASELMLAVEVDEALGEVDPAPTPLARRRWVVAAALAVCLVFLAVRMFTLG